MFSNKSTYYARLYLGQQFWFKTESGYEDIDMVNMVCENGNDVYGLKNDLYFWVEHDKIIDFKLILKSLSDMPKEQHKEYKSLCKRIRHNRKTVYVADTPESLEFALSKGYDMFKLIENDEAFDSRTFPKFLTSSLQQ